jgi:hypothetical protein
MNTAKVRIRMIDNVISLSKQEAYIERRSAGICYLCSKVKWQTQTLAPTGKRLHKQVSFDGRSVYTNNTIRDDRASRYSSM